MRYFKPTNYRLKLNNCQRVLRLNVTWWSLPFPTKWCRLTMVGYMLDRVFTKIQASAVCCPQEYWCSEKLSKVKKYLVINFYNGRKILRNRKGPINALQCYSNVRCRIQNKFESFLHYRDVSRERSVSKQARSGQTIFYKFVIVGSDTDVTTHSGL